MKMENASTTSDMETNNLKVDQFTKFDKQIEDLYKFRDNYYIVNENSINPEDRNQELMTKLNEIVAELEKIENEFESKASYLTLVGRAFNVLPEYNQKAFDSLTKAVKFYHLHLNMFLKIA